VAKLWPSLSVLLVVVMLLFLAPAVLLLPGENVALGNPPNTTQQVEATFSFTEILNGTWATFTAGGASVAGGLALVQYTRENVNSSGQVSGSQFRNFTTGSGNVAGDLSGSSISLAWETLKFNMKYTHTPKYNTTFTATNFGAMTGRGHIDDGAGNNFTFVFIVDFDSNNDMSVAAGKGFMVSVAENGTYGNATSSNPADKHKIIGDFEINKTAGNYTGNFHLRNYDPSEVFDLGDLNVTGVVMQETLDQIGYELALVNITVDTPMYTPNAATNDNASFEDIAWGKDPSKKVNYGHLGGNATMDISRNTVLVNVQHGLAPVTVHIQGTATCNLKLDDTYAVTGNDGTSHGVLWEILLLSIPYQELPVSIPPSFFNQAGYTWTPFGMLNPSTESYAGTESFAYANISIEASTFNATQFSTDWAFGLYPHPQVESVTPSSGYPGQTLNVAIKGKYFLRAGPDAPGSSWSLGPGITVNSWSLKNSSPIDNEIQACITIGSAAATTTRNASVTACFNYENATIRQNMTGELADAFTVNPLTQATLQGNVTFIGRSVPPLLNWSEPFNVALYVAGGTPSPTNALWTGSAVTNTSGFFIISNLTPGSYDIGIKNWTSLSVLKTNVTLTGGVTTQVDFGGIRQGDCKNDDDKVTLQDRILMYSLWGSSDFRGDLKRDGIVNLADRIQMYNYWGQQGNLGFNITLI